MCKPEQLTRARTVSLGMSDTLSPRKSSQPLSDIFEDDVVELRDAHADVHESQSRAALGLKQPPGMAPAP